MTPHPEDAMTRERALIPGLTLVRKSLETYLIVREEDGNRELTAAECEKLYALASAKQEPALSAEVEEATRAIKTALENVPIGELSVTLEKNGMVATFSDGKGIWRDMLAAAWKYPSVQAALRRYAGDGGVTWEPIETAPRDGSIILIDSKPDEPTWLPFVARLIEGPYTFPPGTVWTRAPARAKPSEKGGAR